MTLADQTLLYKPSPSKHIIITYSDSNKLIDLVVKFINEGLKRNQLCVYGTVNVNEKIVEKLSSGIIDYEENIRKENLMLVALDRYIPNVLEHDLTPFEDLKKSILGNTEKRSDKHVRLAGDLVSLLFEKKHFEECMMLEEWWQKNPLGGTSICPYKDSIFDEYPYNEKKEQVIHAHDNMIFC